MRRRVLVRDDLGAGILERLAAGDVIEVMVAVHQELDRLVGDLLDLVDVLLAAGWAAVGDGIGRDHAGRRDDEHRLVVAVPEDVDVVGAVDLLGLDLRSLLRLRRRRYLLRLCRHGQRNGQRCGTNGHECSSCHGRPSLTFLSRSEASDGVACNTITLAHRAPRSSFKQQAARAYSSARRIFQIRSPITGRRRRSLRFSSRRLPCCSRAGRCRAGSTPPPARTRSCRPV